MKKTLCKLSALICISVITLTSTSAHAWRDTGNAGGITEQNISYLFNNFSGVAKSFLQSFSNRLNSAQKNKILALSSELVSNIELRFENQEVADQQAFRVAGHQWWVQTRYLEAYDSDHNDELNWDESFGLLLDLSQAAGLAKLDSSNFSLLKELLHDFFHSKTEQQLIDLNRDRKIQVTTLTNEQLQQTDYILESDRAGILNLMPLAKTFLNCEDGPTEIRYHGPNVKNVSPTTPVDGAKSKDDIDVLMGLSLNYQCGNSNEMVRLLLKLHLGEKTIEITDWGTN